MKRPTKAEIAERRKATEAAVKRMQKAISAVAQGSRKEAGLEQQDVADRLGWSLSKVSKLESGRTVWKLGEAIMYACAVKVPEELFIRRILRWN
jgi:transcriptional regulator with XRE-family HTH domain